MTDAVLKDAQRSIKAGSKSFALASRFFDPEIRADVVRLYAWCRYCDDVVDGQTAGRANEAAPQNDQAARLAELSARTERAIMGRPDDHPAFLGLARILSDHDMDPRHPRDLIAGFAMDVDQRSYRTLDDTLDYAYHVAGVVGVMMAHIMGVRAEPVLDRASDLGLGFQLTNIARDIYEDAAAGRVYVPADLLRSADAPTEPGAIMEAGSEASVHKAAIMLLDEADAYYASAEIGIRELPKRSARAIRAAAHIYRAIGDQIRKIPPAKLRERTFTGISTKLWLSLKANLPNGRGAPADQPARPVHLYRRPAS